MPKISLTIDERARFRASINLEHWGFEKVSDYEFKNADYFNVITGQWNVLFSSKHDTIPVEYDRLEQFLLNKGYVKKQEAGQ